MSPVFEVTLKDDVLNPEIGGKKIRRGKYKVVTAGYWLFLRPNSLKPDELIIETFGSSNNGRLSLDIHHHFTII
jgi:hypothetical protein